MGSYNMVPNLVLTLQALLKIPNFGELSPKRKFKIIRKKGKKEANNNPPLAFPKRKIHKE